MTVRSKPEDVFSGDASLLSSIRARFNKSALLVAHLKWVAIHSDHQSAGIGTLLMGRAIDDFYNITDRTGIAARTLEPINQRSREFYKDLGFIPYGGGDFPAMFLSAETVMRAKEAIS